MANKRILIANADPRTLADYGRALDKEWTVKLVAGADAALAEMALQPCDVLVADCALPDANQGVQLLDRVHAEHPRTIRILMAGEEDKEQRADGVIGSHLVLTKPCDGATLKGAIQRALALDLWLPNDSLRELVARLRTFPIVPSLYLEVTHALKSPHTTTVEVGAIIAKDMAMMTKLLQVTNSACFGLPRKISDPVEAVGILGFETVKSMVMTLKLLSQYDKVKPVYFSIDRLWRHSTEVARISRRLALTQSADPGLAESSFTAGLMHDLGKLVLASNFDAQYSGAQSLARQQRIPLWEVEKQIFGASHADIGAYLLGLWGMPLDLVEAAALHHNPSRSLAKSFNPLTAVHLANCLVYQAKPDREGFVAPEIDEAHLAELGLSGQLQRWRQMILTPDLEHTEFRARTADTATIKKTAAHAAKPAPRPARPRTAPASILTIPRQRWAFAGTLVVLFLITFFLASQTLVRMAVESTVQPPRARAANQTVPAATAPPFAPAAPLSVAPPAASPEDSAPVAGPSEATVEAAPSLPPPSASERAFAQLQLQSIFYSQGNPSAVISGTRVRPLDRLPAGAMVVEITPSSVTLQFDNERKILALR